MQPKSTPKSSTSGGQCDYQKLINGLRDASPAEKKLFDLPVDLVLSIADFLPKEDQACLALTCHGARDIFKERKLKLTKRETHRFLQVLQREHPTDIICQHRLQLVDRCHEPTADPGDRAARVMLRHRLGPDYGSSLDSLSHRSQLTKKETWAADYTCDTSLRFRIMDNKLYMHGKYVFKGKYLIRALTFTSHHFDICPHMYLDHDRGSYAGRQRVPVRLPGRKCRFLDFFCRCAVNGAFDPSWTTRRRSESDRQSYFTPPKSCRFCATDVAFSFDDVQELQTFEVDFWRCLGDGGLEDSENFWLTGALSERNENGEGATAFRPIPRLMKAETFHRFSEADNPT
ncbi:hypothetical protein BKA80DRAFT_341744 [Phyllosticta citrichinensis]